MPKDTNIPMDMGLEHKFCRLGDTEVIEDGIKIEGYASLFGAKDQGGDIVARGAYGKSLKTLEKKGRNVKMLWQHDPAQPIGVWDEVREDDKGLFVKGRLLNDIEKGREAAALIEAGAIDGLSIGYRTVKAQKNDSGARVLSELELWEVSLVTFPMLPDARLNAEAKGQDLVDPDAAANAELCMDLAEAFRGAAKLLADGD